MTALAVSLAVSVGFVCFTYWKTTERKTTTAPLIQIEARLEKLEAKANRVELQKLAGGR